MTNGLTADELKIYHLSLDQKYDAVRAVMVYRRIMNNPRFDDAERAHQKRLQTGVTLPVDPDDKDMVAFVAKARGQGDRIEAVDHEAKSVVARWFDSEPGRKYRALAFLEGADDEIRSLYADALENISGFDVKPDELALIATTRPGEYWKLGGQTTLQVVIEHVSEPIGCDLDSFAHDDFGPCIETHERMLAGIAKCDGIGRDGKPNKLRRDYIAENFATVPFAIGNVIVLVKICRWCFGSFIGRNNIDSNRIGYVVPKTDGYGCVGAGPITQSEYLRDESAAQR